LLAQTALAIGGLPGQRILRLHGFNYSRNTLLRAARSAAIDDANAVPILGVDAYAYRRGLRYGTLLYDLTERKVIDRLGQASATPCPGSHSGPVRRNVPASPDA